MKKYIKSSIVLVSLCFATLGAHAIPAKPGIWNIITLTDGTQIHAQLRGNSHLSFYEDSQKNVYQLTDNGRYQLTTREALSEMATAQQVREEAEAVQALKKIGKRKAQGIPTDKSIFTGRKKGIVILVQFPKGTYNGTSYPAVSFDTENPDKFGCKTVNALYKKIINERNLQMPPFYGSVKDYFLAQSDGIFELDFDVVGPYTLSNPYPYYGYQSSSSSHDRNPRAMITEAVNLANNDGADFSQYDWDNDGTVEVVYVLYAGQGQADGGNDNTIWPHKSQVSTSTRVDGKYISIYACSNELATNRKYDSKTDSYIVNGLQINGIGTICHEFSHTIGYPDMYDTSYSYTGCEMGSWDLMCSGSYNGSWNGGHDDWRTIDAGYRPAGYTAFERWCAGWIEPKVLTDPQRITNMKPLGGTLEGGASDHGDAYVIYMPNATQSIRGKYYLLENRQRVNWDGALPWRGLLINYVDYNESYWQNNSLNTPSSSGYEHLTHFQASGIDYLSFVELDTYPYDVDLLPKIFLDTNEFYDADGKTMAEKFNAWFEENYSDYSGKVKLNTQSTNELTNSSNPSAYYYTSSSSWWSSSATKNTLSNQEIWNIETNSNNDLTVDFNYRYPSTKTFAMDQTDTEVQGIGTGFYTKVTTDRNIRGGGTYNTLWLPFSLNQSEVKHYFGSNAKVYSFTGYNKEEGLLFEETTQEGIQAYTPVLVQLGEEDKNIEQLGGEDGFTYVQVNDADVDPVVTTEDGWKFIGTKEYSTIPVGAYYLSDNKYYQSKGNAKLKAYRAYFTAPETENSQSLKLATRVRRDIQKALMREQSEEDAITCLRNHLSEDNMESPLFRPVNHATSINGMMTEKAKAMNNSVYDLSGRRVIEPKSGLYIANGKKIMVK